MTLPGDRAEEFLSLWFDTTASAGYIRERFGLSHKGLEAVRLRFGLPRRPNRSQAIWNPTAEEIETRAREARAGRSAARRERDERAERVTIPCYSFDRKTMSYR